MFEPGQGDGFLDPAELAWYQQRAAELDPADPLDEVSSPLDALVDAERRAVTPPLAARVLAVEVADLDADGRISLAINLSRVRNAVDARLAEVIAADVAATPAVETAKGRVRISPPSQTSLAMAAALRLGTGAANTFVARSVDLVQRHPRTLAALRSGDVSWDKATSLVDATAPLTPEKATAVEDRVLPKAADRVPSQHRAAIKRAIEAVDPDGAAERHRRARTDVRFIREHYGNGVGSLFVRLPAEQLDVVWTAADRWARGRKADGDVRSLEALRVEALVQWARSFLVHGDPTHCDTTCDPFVNGYCACAVAQTEPGDDPDVRSDIAGRPQQTAPARSASAQSTPPTQHGRPATVSILWDLPGLLGLTDRGGELVDSGAPICTDTIRALIADGLRLRRMLVDSKTGDLLDLPTKSWLLAPNGEQLHSAPYTLLLVIDEAMWHALTTGDITDLEDPRVAEMQRIAAAIEGAGVELCALLRAMLDHPLTSDNLDRNPAAGSVPADLAEFVALRDRHPMTPTASPTAATTGDADHTVARRDGGQTVRDNLATPSRRWHVAKTHGRWTLGRDGRGWVWVSPTGRRYRVDPHDYRLGP